MSEIVKALRKTLWAQRIYYPIKELEYALLFKHNPEKFIKAEYKRRVKNGSVLDLKNPTRLTEKMNWLKLYYVNDNMFRLGDKFFARQYVKESIGEQYLVPIYDYFTNENQLDMGKYPREFVIKGTHNSGDVILCRDKAQLDIKKLRKELKIWLKKDFYKKSKEPSYKKAVPGILIEKYLETDAYNTPKDYKIFCFNGQPQYIAVYSDRYGKNKRVGQIVYDKEWNVMPFIFGTEEKFERNLKNKEEKPSCFEEMMDVSRKLSSEFPFVRVDLYVINGKIYFGEMTFFHLNGYFQCTPPEWDLKMGQMLDIS